MNWRQSHVLRCSKGFCPRVMCYRNPWSSKVPTPPRYFQTGIPNGQVERCFPLSSQFVVASFQFMVVRQSWR